MSRNNEKMATAAFQHIAIREGKTMAQVREEIRKAILIGLGSPDPRVQARWKRIPCQGPVPTPEEVVLFLAGEAGGRSSL